MASGWRRPLLLAGGCWGAFVVVLVAAYWRPVARWGHGWAVEGFLNLHRPWLKNIAVHVAHMANPLPFALLGPARDDRLGPRPPAACARGDRPAECREHRRADAEGS